MSRRVRMIKPGYQHPRNKNGDYVPLFDGSKYQSKLVDWEEQKAQWDLGYVLDYGTYPERNWKLKDGDEGDDFEEWHGKRPEAHEYMPTWAEGEATFLVMYEETSEGTPISPPFETPEKLARWLADNGASAFGSHTASYEDWLAVCCKGWAPSGAIDHGRVISGVEAISRSQKD